MSERRLPDGWRWVRLGDICTAIRGVTFSSGEANPNEFENSIACLTTRGVQDTVDWSSRSFIPKVRLSSNEQILRMGDLLVSTANSKALVGKSCLVRSVPFVCSFGAFVTVLRPTDTVVNPFMLATLMRAPETLGYFYATSSNTTNISNLRVSDLLAFEVPLPPLPEQRRIAAIIEEQMAAVEQARAAAQTQLDAAEGLMAAYLRDVFESEEAQGWERVQLGNVLTRNNEVVHPYENPSGPATFVGLEHIGSWGEIDAGGEVRNWERARQTGNDG